MTQEGVSTGCLSARQIYLAYGFRPNQTSSMPAAVASARNVNGWHRDSSHDSSVRRVRFPQPISVDISFFTKAVENSLMADRRKLEPGWSSQELYVRSNPNLLMCDSTNPRTWYNSAAQKNILKSVNLNQNDSNNNDIDGYVPRGKFSKAKGQVRLPRLNTQERISGSKSAENTVNKTPSEFPKTFLTRGPSFDEATAKLRKATLFSLSDSTFPPPLGKSISWPRGSGPERKRHVSRSSKRSVETSHDDSRISLPPLNPDCGHPFIPHLPSHKPWASSTQNNNRQANCDLKQRKDVPKQSDQELRQTLSSQIGLEQNYTNKVKTWTNEMTSDANFEVDDHCLANERIHNNSPLHSSEPLAPNSPMKPQLAPRPPVDPQPFQQSHRKTKRTREMTKILVPDLKDPVQFAPVYQQLRIDRTGKPNENTHINRSEYKLKQRSSLHLKMVDAVKNSNENKDPTAIGRIQLEMGEINNIDVVSETQSACNRETKEQKKKGARKKKKSRTMADRHTGMKFLLARVPEDSNSEDYSSDGDVPYGAADVLNNNMTAARFPSEAGIESGENETSCVTEPKPSVVNLTLSAERQHQRNPLHIELSLKKIADRKVQGTGEEVIQRRTPEQSEVCQDVAGFIATNSADVSPVPAMITSDADSLANKNHAAVNGIPDDNGETTNQSDSMHAESAVTNKAEKILDYPENADDPDVARDKTVTDNTQAPGLHKDSPNAVTMVTQDDGGKELPSTTNVSTTHDTTTFTLAYKSDKSALTKYNLLQPFRDNSQPNIILPLGGQPVGKPACNEWTHPPTYKLDLRNYDSATNDNNNEVV